MQLQIDVNSVKSTIFLELLNLFKKDNMINDYKVIDNQNNYTDYENEILGDLKDLKSSMCESGIKTNKYIEINDK